MGTLVTVDLDRPGVDGKAPRQTSSLLSVILCGAIAAGIPFAIGVANILNHFYHDGAYLLDSGLLAYLMTNPDPSLPLPRVLGGGSFYAIHISPLFSGLAALAQLLPLTPPQFFAGFIGAVQALLAIGAYWALVGPLQLRGWIGNGFAALLAIAFANNGLAIALLRYPHFEGLIAAAAILFLLSLHQRRYGLASLFFVLALVTREDAGLHIALLLTSIVIFRRSMAIAQEQEATLLTYLLIGFFYSALAMVAQHAFFPNQSSFARIYSGTPPYAHLNLTMLVTRSVGVLLYRAYAILPAIVAIGWAILRRNPYLIAGYASTLPWIIIHFLAISEVAGTLSAHYPFPLLIGGFWPLLGVLREERVAGPTERREAVVGFLLMIIASFVAVSHQPSANKISFIGNFAPPPRPQSIQAVTRDIATLTSVAKELGNTLVDSSIASLVPDTIPPTGVIGSETTEPVDTIIYFANSFESDDAEDLASDNRLSLLYELRDAPIRIATNRDLARISALAPLARRLSKESAPASH